MVKRLVLLLPKGICDLRILNQFLKRNIQDFLKKLRNSPLLRIFHILHWL